MCRVYFHTQTWNIFVHVFWLFTTARIANSFEHSAKSVKMFVYSEVSLQYDNSKNHIENYWWTYTFYAADSTESDKWKFYKCISPKI